MYEPRCTLSLELFNVCRTKTGCFDSHRGKYSGSVLLRHLLRTRRFHECGGRQCGQCHSVDALNAGIEDLSFFNDVPSLIAHEPPRLAVANVETLSSNDSSGTFGNGFISACEVA